MLKYTDITQNTYIQSWTCNRTDMIDLFEERKIQKLLQLLRLHEFI
jgi:hypothetical protein